MDLEPQNLQETQKTPANTDIRIPHKGGICTYFNLLDFSLVSPSLQHPAIRKAIFALP